MSHATDLVCHIYPVTLGRKQGQGLQERLGARALYLHIQAVSYSLSICSYIELTYIHISIFVVIPEVCVRALTERIIV